MVPDPPPPPSPPRTEESVPRPASRAFDPEFLQELLGSDARNVAFLEQAAQVRLAARGETLLLDGEAPQVEACFEVLEQLQRLFAAGIRLNAGDLRTALALRSEGFRGEILDFYREAKVQCAHGRVVFPKSLNQGRYLRAIRERDVVFGIGPAGTGKTYLAVAMAVSALREKRVKRIILCRPAVEAGEKLGFLPGDIAEKVNPYLRPLYDALFDLMEADRVAKYLETGILEIAPIAFMRGRTLNDSFVILDEAQNTTIDQMKMFLTRLGFNSKTVVTGDVTQIDIDPSRKSGLVDAAEVLRGIPGLAFVSFTEKDVVRHPLVQEIIKAYERASGR